MEIEIVKERKVEKELHNLGDMEVGTVIQFSNEKNAVVIQADERMKGNCECGKALLLLADYDNADSYEPASYSFNEFYKKGYYKVIGKIKKIIVEEQ